MCGAESFGGVGLHLGAQGEQHKGLTEDLGGACAWLVGWGAGEEVTVFQGESAVPLPGPGGAAPAAGS